GGGGGGGGGGRASHALGAPPDPPLAAVRAAPRRETARARHPWRRAPRRGARETRTRSRPRNPAPPSPQSFTPARPTSVMSVCVPVAQCTRRPAFSTYASRRHTVSVR